MTPFACRVRVACAAVVLTTGLATAQPSKVVPVPPAADIAAATDTLKDVFDKEYAAADAKAKRTLAKKLLDLAPQRKTPAMIFACYEEARRLSAANGDVTLAVAAVETMNKRFSNIGDFLRDTLKQLATSELSATDAVALAKIARTEAAAALDREDYSGAVELATVAAAAAKKAEDVDLAGEVRTFRTRAESLAAAVAKVKAEPDDAAANTTLGTYWAFDRGRWDAGLKYLAKGSDKPLADAATKDLTKPKAAKDRTATADLWYKLSKDATGDRKRPYAERAWEWYASALAVATGDDDLKPSERAKEIEAAYPTLFNRTLDGHTAAAAAVAVTPDGATLVSVGNDHAVRVWEAATGRPLKALDGHTHWVGSVVVTPDGTRAITAGGDNAIRVWDLKMLKEVATLEGHTLAVRGLALTADGQFLVSGASDKTIRLWNLTTLKEVRRFGDAKQSVESVAITPDGKHVLAGNEVGSVTVFDGKTGEVVTKFNGHGGSMVYTVAVTKDGKTAVSGARDKEIRVWEVATGKPIRTLRGHTEQVYQVAFSPDETHLLSASFDRTVRIWDFASGKELKSFEGHTDCVQGVCPAPDGRSVFSASWDKSVRQWRIPVDLDAKKVD